MKAIVQNEYGSADVLELKEIDKPVVKENDVLVRVHAAALHAGDVFVMRGVPYLVRMSAGWPKPKSYVPGYDVAGQVEAVGKNVTRLQPGDEVFGACNGACAEYVCAGEDTFVLKPVNLTFGQAAAVPTSALAALHGIRDAGKVEPGQKVLINGASGGVGTFAVQIAKSFGAEVTGVCSTRNVDMVRSIGADHVIDYTQEDFTQSTGSVTISSSIKWRTIRCQIADACSLPRGLTSPTAVMPVWATLSRRSCHHSLCANRGARTFRCRRKRIWLF